MLEEVRFRKSIGWGQEDSLEIRLNARSKAAE
jgi:hypothetical protein